MILPICDRKRHLVCHPYSLDNLHKMAESMGIKRCWFHRDHYDIPKRRIKEISDQCFLTSTMNIAKIIRGKKIFKNEG